MSITVMCGKRLNLWKTMPISRRTSFTLTCGSVMHCPRKNTWPAVGFSSRLRQRKKVLLPDPDGPMTTTTSWGLTVTSIPRSTWLVPKDFSSPQVLIKYLQPLFRPGYQPGNCKCHYQIDEGYNHVHLKRPERPCNNYLSFAEQVF